MKIVRGLLCWILFLSIGYSLVHFCRRETGKFILTAITTYASQDPVIPASPPSSEEELSRALDQEYSYLGCGGQAYVFSSANGEFVIKLLKKRRYRIPGYLYYIPFIQEYRAAKEKKYLQRLKREFSSYRIAFESFSRECALLYLHLDKSSHLNLSLTLIDKLQIKHQIDLDSTYFILQRKAQPPYLAISELMSKSKIEESQRILTLLIDLILLRYQRGYSDGDPNIEKNCGVLKDRVIKMDIGRFAPHSEEKLQICLKVELYSIMRPLQHWIRQNHPELLPYLDAQLMKIIVSS